MACVVALCCLVDTNVLLYICTMLLYAGPIAGCSVVFAIRVFHNSCSSSTTKAIGAWFVASSRGMRRRLRIKKRKRKDRRKKKNGKNTMV